MDLLSTVNYENIALIVLCAVLGLSMKAIIHLFNQNSKLWEKHVDELRKIRAEHTTETKELWSFIQSNISKNNDLIKELYKSNAKIGH